jgi:thiamine biosynthesis lipoprotein
MNWPEFHHEAMATTFTIVIAGQQAGYARQAAAAAFLELDRLEGELSRFVESSDIARANRLARGETVVIGDDALRCLLLAAELAEVSGRAFDAAYATVPAASQPADAPSFTLDPRTHTLTSQAEHLQLDLGAIGKGYALDRLAELLGEWNVTSACLQSGGSTLLALDAPPGEAGWAFGLGDGAAHRVGQLVRAALSASGTTVKGSHLIDPRSGMPSTGVVRAWALAPTAAMSDALSTAFFVMPPDCIARFCTEYPEVGAAWKLREGRLRTEGRLNQQLAKHAGDRLGPKK